VQQARRHEVLGPSGQHHQFATRARQVVGQHWHAQRRQPHPLDDARRVVAFQAEVGQHGQRLIVLLDPRQQNGGVIAGCFGHFAARRHPTSTPLQKLRQGLVVALQLE
jgi:hypothetical protein